MTMRRINIFLALAFLFTSCVVDDVQYLENGPINTDSGLKIIGAVQDFDVKRVTTRANDGDAPADSYISEMTMFVFDKNDQLIQGYSNRTVTAVDAAGLPAEITFNDADKCSSAVNIAKANPTFLIDTQEGMIASLDEASPRIIYYDNLTNNDLTECKIYIVANAWHKLSSELDNIKALADLEAVTLDIDETLAMPKKDDVSYYGFPMIGTHKGQTFDLTKSGDNTGAVAKIPLKKLYSKVNFSIQINANQVVSTPKFRIVKAEVFNVPSKARLGRELDSNGKPTYENSDDYIVEMVGNAAYTPSDYYHFTDNQPFIIDKFSRREIQHTTSKNLTSGSEFLIEFGFYMPEHKVTPNFNSSTFKGYPANIEEDFKQYYKPDLVDAVREDDGTTTNGKNATFVRIHGKYTDHNGQIKDVRYDIYLGQDNTDDFTVKRNQLLNNKLVITGLTNYHDAYGDDQQNISVDHRVDVDYSGFNLSMEREAILDAHFEVRPLDVELSPGGSMTITIPEQYRSWIAMESDADAYTGEGSPYVSDVYRKGVRKYFTTNLVSELNAKNSGNITVKHSGTTENGDTEIHRIWFYIDENPHVYDKLWKEGTVSYANATGDSFTTTDGYTVNTTTTDGYTVNKTMYRNCPVEFKFTGIDNDNTDGSATVTKTATINFQQWNLWRVWSADKKRYYDIEHEEEYLNNYASDQLYGGTQNGMPWGLEGIQLSNKIDAIVVTSEKGFAMSILEAIGMNFDTWYTSIINKLEQKPYYDFYLQRDGFRVDLLEESVDKSQYSRDYKGIVFNNEIAATLRASSDPKAKIDGITLTDSPRSAFAYCYHKNKRNSSGQVVEQKWFLPAIDEIEDIALGAYDEFDKVFQNEKYWSCQPAYDKIYLEMPIIALWQHGTIKADYFIDDLDRARATSIETDGTDYNNIDSGVPGYTGTQDGEMKWTTPTLDDVSFNNNVDYTNHLGNLPRTQKCRIRAVYRSGNVE